VTDDQHGARIVLPGRFNAHAHLRDVGPENYGLLPYVARVQRTQFDWCVAMPNTKPPILTGEDALRYVERITNAAPGLGVIPVCYLTLATTPQMVREAARAGVKAYKLYPAGATTNSSHGVTLAHVWELDQVFREMALHGLILCLHGEDPDLALAVREMGFGRELRWLAETYPTLRIVFEHISSAAMVRTCLEYDNVWMTVTPHHLVLTEADVPLSPHHLCMPIAKTAADRLALQELIASGHPRVCAGLDDAPHPIGKKLSTRSENVPFGVWGPEAALGVYARELERRSALHQLPSFFWGTAAALYGIPDAAGRPASQPDSGRRRSEHASALPRGSDT
jgi:dihydroorotase